MHELRSVLHGRTATHQHLRQRLTQILLVSLAVDAVGTVLIFLLERHAHGTEIRTLGDSLFWTSTQLLTVSSQLPNPISTGARILDVFLQAYATSVVATLAGSFASFFHRRSHECHPLEPATRRSP